MGVLCAPKTLLFAEVLSLVMDGSLQGEAMLCMEFARSVFLACLSNWLSSQRLALSLASIVCDVSCYITAKATIQILGHLVTHLSLLHTLGSVVDHFLTEGLTLPGGTGLRAH